jgi:hypothetical protein
VLLLLPHQTPHQQLPLLPLLLPLLLPPLLPLLLLLLLLLLRTRASASTMRFADVASRCTCELSMNTRSPRIVLAVV